MVRVKRMQVFCKLLPYNWWFRNPPPPTWKWINSWYIIGFLWISINLNWWVYRILCPSKTFMDSHVGSSYRMRMIRDVYPKRRLTSPGGKSWEVGLHLVSTSRGGSTWRKRRKKKRQKRQRCMMTFSWCVFFPRTLVSCWEAPFFEDLVSACRKGRLFSLR